MLINQIKQIVENYLNYKALTRIEIGTVVSEGVRVSDRLVIPFDFLTGNEVRNLVTGDRVRLLRNQGASEYYVLEIIRGD